jgi:hypothetical protein
MLCLVLTVLRVIFPTLRRNLRGIGIVARFGRGKPTGASTFQGWRVYVVERIGGIQAKLLFVGLSRYSFLLLLAKRFVLFQNQIKRIFHYKLPAAFKS